MTEKEFRFWSILQRVCLYSFTAFMVLALILAFVFHIYVPGWVIFVASALLIGTFGACVQIRGEAMIKAAVGNNASVDGNLGITMFPEPGPVMDLKSFEILQVHSNGQALAYSSDKVPAQPIIDYHGPTVLFLPDKNQPYYDHLVITVPEGKIVRQVGTYRYKARDGVKTVPIISFQELNK
jgi:hypothetical protein